MNARWDTPARGVTLAFFLVLRDKNGNVEKHQARSCLREILMEPPALASTVHRSDTHFFRRKVSEDVDAGDKLRRGVGSSIK